MEEVGKWRVTYSKHITQKRKLYHDGFLHLLSNNKVLLFDESHKLLDSKFLNKLDALSLKPAFSFSFPSFLVDIDHCISINPNAPLKPPPPTTPLALPQPLLSPSFQNSRQIKPSTSIQLLLLLTLLLHFSLPLLLKNGKCSTLHILLKRPRSITMASYSSFFAALMLPRFLNKDEIISSGQTLKFDAHLVDIGNVLCNPNTTNDAYLKTQPRHYTSDQVQCRQKLSNGKSRNLAGFNTCHGASFSGSRTNRMNIMKTPHSLMPPRDVHHILSILKKPADQDDVPIPEKAELRLSQSSVVQFVINGKPNEGITQINKVTNDNDSDGAANRGSAQTWSTDDDSQPQTFYTMETAQPSTDCSSNYVERPFLNQGSVFEPPNKIEPSSGITPINKLRANDIPQQSVIDHPVHLAGFMGSVSSGSQETRSTHQQPCAKLPETDASSVERTSSTSIKPKAKRPFNELNGMKIKRSDVNSEFSLGTLDCPSFELGI